MGLDPRDADAPRAGLPPAASQPPTSGGSGGPGERVRSAGCGSLGTTPRRCSRSAVRQGPGRRRPRRRAPAQLAELPRDPGSGPAGSTGGQRPWPRSTGPGASTRTAPQPGRFVVGCCASSGDSATPWRPPTALTLHPGWPDHHVARAAVLVRVGRVGEALAEITEAVEARSAQRRGVPRPRRGAGGARPVRRALTAADDAVARHPEWADHPRPGRVCCSPGRPGRRLSSAGVRLSPRHRQRRRLERPHVRTRRRRAVHRGRGGVGPGASAGRRRRAGLRGPGRPVPADGAADHGAGLADRAGCWCRTVWTSARWVRRSRGGCACSRTHRLCTGSGQCAPRSTGNG